MVVSAGQIGVVFDCDGTLLDSIGAWREVESELARRAGAELSRDDTDTLTTLTLPESGAFFHERLGLGTSAGEVMDMINDLMLAYYSERACERPGALTFVRALAERGVRMSVASSTPQLQLRAGLEHAGFLPYLDAVVSVDDVGKSKREPAVYDHARQLMGTPKATTWAFEDAAYALRTLRAARYHTVGVYDCDLSGTYAELAALATHVVTSFEDLDASTFVGWTRA